MKLPVEIQTLLDRHGKAVDAAAILSDHGTGSAKATYKIDFADCSSAKARLHGTDAWAGEVENLQELIGPHPSFSATLARSGRAVLEEWVPGATLHDLQPTPETLRACGRLLANLHGVPVAEQAAAPDAIESTCVRLREHLEWLCASGVLGARDVEALLAIARDSAPPRAKSGIIHFDFCGRNVVLHADRGPVCIDNETLRIGPFDLDLARTFYRWPLTRTERECFLAGYADAGGPAEVTHLPFWSLAAEVCSAFVRCRDGSRDAGVPLATLRERIGQPARVTPANASSHRTSPC